MAKALPIGNDSWISGTVTGLGSSTDTSFYRRCDRSHRMMHRGLYRLRPEEAGAVTGLKATLSSHRLVTAEADPPDNRLEWRSADAIIHRSLLVAVGGYAQRLCPN